MVDHPAFLPLIRQLRRIGALSSALNLLGWDQETVMPDGGTSGRAAAVGDLTEVIHRMSTSVELGDAVAAAEEALPDVPGVEGRALVREARRAYDRKRKVPPELAQQIARTSAESLPAWKQARAQNDFSIFRPYLERMFSLRRREAEALADGKRAPLYDLLLDEYEPGATAADIERHIASVKPALIRLLAETAPRTARLRSGLLDGHYDRAGQERFANQVIRAMGFDLTRGRVDVSAHPFCSGISSPGDVRLTTRYSERSFIRAIFGLMHEAGHGLYEQGLDPAWAGTPIGSAVSMGIHESQSRLWENLVGRGAPFWNHYLPLLKREFPGQLDRVDAPSFLAAVNRVEPSFIRVEADEVTYNLHIMLRFEVEQALLGEALEVADLPGYWNEKSRAYLGITPPTDTLGCLQDIHWSFGAVGYFPTYFLGNLYAAQFYRAAARAIPDLDAEIARGDLHPLRGWLEREIHRHGAIYTAPELCEKVTGDTLDARVFIEYLERKMRAVHS